MDFPENSKWKAEFSAPFTLFQEKKYIYIFHGHTSMEIGPWKISLSIHVYLDEFAFLQIYMKRMQSLMQ